MKSQSKYILVILTVSILTLLFFYSKSLVKEKSMLNKSSYALQVIEKDSLWIYEIYDKGNLFIRQEYIPAVKGKQVFTSKNDAEKIGNLVVTKLAKDEFPVISIADLDHNNIYFEKI